MDWSGIVQTWGTVVAVIGGMWVVLRPYLPLLCEAVRVYAEHTKDIRRREILLLLVRAAEEIYVGAKRGEEKHQWVYTQGDMRGYSFSDAEIRAAARETTKELAGNLPVRRDPP